MFGIADYVEPVDGKYRITSHQGNRRSGRTSNGAKMSKFHHGLDIAGATPGSKPAIRNITAGRVVFAGKAGGWGNAVIIENPQGYRVQYGHLDSINVNIGDTVPAGGQIGVMGASGNVTGVHLDLIVTKDGKTLKPDGSALANAPASIARRAKSFDSGSKYSATANEPPKAATSPMFAVDNQKPNISAYPDVGSGDDDLFGGEPMAVLQGATGLAIPTSKTENTLFSELLDMNLDKDLEGIYAEAAKAIAKAKDSITSEPMIQSHNPLRAELGEIFDRLEV